jgi:hypothetical protein
LTGDDDHGVGGHVPALEEIAGILRRHGIEVVHPADDRMVIRGCHEGLRVQRFPEQRMRRVFRAHPPFFLDHLEFVLELFFRPLVVGEAVGLELHHVLQPAGRDLLVEAGVVLPGEGVLHAAQRRHAAGKLAGRHRRRALEHHVFQDVGDPGGSADFIDRADTHPHHVDGGRSPPVGLDDQRHPVGEGEFLGLGRALRQRRGHEAHGQEKAEEESEQARRGVFHRIV